MQQFPFEKILTKSLKFMSPGFLRECVVGQDRRRVVHCNTTHISFPGHASSHLQFYFFGDACEPSIMTLPFEINIEIARACGWKTIYKLLYASCERVVKGEEDK